MVEGNEPREGWFGNLHIHQTGGGQWIAQESDGSQRVLAENEVRTIQGLGAKQVPETRFAGPLDTTRLGGGGDGVELSNVRTTIDSQRRQPNSVKPTKSVPAAYRQGISDKFWDGSMGRFIDNGLLAIENGIRSVVRRVRNR